MNLRMTAGQDGQEFWRDFITAQLALDLLLFGRLPRSHGCLLLVGWLALRYCLEV